MKIKGLEISKPLGGGCRQRGFSLIEIMVVMGIMTIVITSTGAAIGFLLDATKRIDAKLAVTSLTTEIQALSSAKSTCSSALGTNQPFALDLADDPRLHSDGSINSDPDQGLDIQYVLNGVETLAPSLELNSYPLRVESLKLFDAVAVGANSAGQSVYKVNLVGTFSAKVGSLYQAFAPKMLGSFFIAINDSHQITSCFGDQSGDQETITEITSVICSDLGGEFVAGKCQGLAATTGADSTRLPTSTGTAVSSSSRALSCPVGQFINSINADGSATCSSPPSGGGVGGASCTEGAVLYSGYTTCKCIGGSFVCEDNPT